ncbi:MAG: ParB/RepB/Spo0J family partition protein [Betaproteobacteria bacterium]
MKSKGLGRGLSALLEQDETGASGAETQATARLDQLRPGKYQPRTRMDDASLAELAASIKEQGLMQPILVRPVATDGGKNRYEIIAGERRWRAAKIAGLDEVPVLVREVADKAALAMALIENIQREDLNPLEEAAGIHRLVTEFKLTHQQAAEALGRSRTATTNLLRLLQLTEPVQRLMFDGKLDMGHARALLSLDVARQEALARKIADEVLSVRQTEQLVHSLLHPKKLQPSRSAARSNRDIQRLEEELSETLGTTVNIKAGKKGSGTLVIHYANAEHLETLLAKVRR